MYMKKQTKREAAARGVSAVASRPSASRCNYQLRALPRNLRRAPIISSPPAEPALYSTPTRNNGQAARRACLRESVRACISAYAECMTPNDSAAAPLLNTRYNLREVQQEKSTFPFACRVRSASLLVGGFLRLPSASSVVFSAILA